MRTSIKKAALLALPTLSNAVSLADMTPRATGLTGQCEAVYTSQIYGCTATDFQTNQCSTSCINALYGISQAIYHVCANQGITGQNLIVAFLAGVGPQQLCHNANKGGDYTPSPTYMRGPQTTHWQPTIGSTTTTAPKITELSSLLVDTSSTITQTIVPHHTHVTSVSSSSQPPETTTTSKTTQTTMAAEHTTAAHSPDAVSATTSTAGNPQTSMNDHSGGGSPFDTAGNTGAAASISISMGLTIISATTALLLALR